MKRPLQTPTRPELFILTHTQGGEHFPYILLDAYNLSLVTRDAAATDPGTLNK